MIFTDTHTHLYSSEFDEDRAEMVKRALDAGVSRLFVPSIDSSCMDAMYALEREFAGNVFLMAGLHPCYVKENYKEELAFVREQLSSHRFYAVGEIGVDLYWDKSTLGIQQDAFNSQIEMAKAHGLGINIHCRDAFEAVFEVLESQKGGDLYGIFHCFTGDFDEAMRAISYGLKLGIGGVSTFKNGKIDQFLGDIDLSHIVLETDSPYLSPVPYRGKRNESAYTVLVAEKLASLYDVSVAEIARITTENSKKVFGI